jgi:hypothetical protein
VSVAGPILVDNESDRELVAIVGGVEAGTLETRNVSLAPHSKTSVGTDLGHGPFTIHEVALLAPDCSLLARYSIDTETESGRIVVSDSLEVQRIPGDVVSGGVAEVLTNRCAETASPAP